MDSLFRDGFLGNMEGPQSSAICVTLLFWNNSLHDWKKIKKHLQGYLHDNLILDIHNLKEQILASLTTINKYEYDHLEKE